MIEPIKRTSLGKSRFRDGALRTLAEIVVCKLDQKGISLFLDIDVDKRGVMGAGDCEVGFDKVGTSRLLAALERAIQVARTEEMGWKMAGDVHYNWCDRDVFEDTSGRFLVDGRHEGVRLTVRLDPRNELEDYVATLDLKATEKLVSLLRTV